MTFMYRRMYIGPIQGVILDWSGTTVDYGCFAPTVVFVELFKERGVPITMAEARGPMGMYKRDHIRQIMQTPAVTARWQGTHGRLPDERDVDALYQAFIPRQIECITMYADLIPSVKETIESFHQRGLKVGSTTGYTRQMMDALLPEVKKRGYNPDSLVCPDEVGGGRPAPWMCFRNAQNLGIYPMESFVKIGDTLPDIEEKLNAGTWIIALAKTGNAVGLSEAEVATLDPAELKARLAPIYRAMYAAGAHYVVDSLIDTLPILDRIDERLASGEKP